MITGGKFFDVGDGGGKYRIDARRSDGNRRTDWSSQKGLLLVAYESIAGNQSCPSSHINFFTAAPCHVKADWWGIKRKKWNKKQ